MTVEDNVSRLVDMGIDAEVARKALLKADNQPEVAINLIYGGEVSERALVPLGSDEVEAPKGPQGPQDPQGPPVPPLPARLDLRKHELPQRPVATTPVTIDKDLRSKIAQYGYNVGGGGEPTPSESSSGISSSDSESFVSAYNVYNDIPRTARTPRVPPLLLPDSQGMLEGYMAPLLMVLCQLPKFRDAVLHHEFFNYGYAKRWWDNERCLASPQVTQEMQRIAAFLTYPESKRQFSSIRSLVDTTARIATENYEGVSEFVLFVYRSLVDLFAVADPSVKDTLAELFETKISSPLVTDSYKSFTIETSFLNTDIYRVMHSLLWEATFGNLGQNRFQRVSDVLTLVFDGGERVKSGGFELNEEFYPQIYTAECDHLVKKQIDRLAALKTESANATSQMLRLRSYKGKKVDGMFDATIKYLQTVSESKYDVNAAVKELQAIQSHVVETRDKDSRRMEEISRERQAIDMYDIDSILGDTEAQLEPWVLAGVIVNERQFCYPTKDRSSWHCFVYELEGTKNFDYQPLTFDELQQQIRQYSRTDFEQGMVLMYVRKSVFEDDKAPFVNENLRQFILRDNEQLQADLNAYVRANEYEEEEVRSVYSSQSSSGVESAREE